MSRLILRVPQNGKIITIKNKKCLCSSIIFIVYFFIDSLGDVISEGTFGYVCSASNLKSDEKIAIKFYKKQESKKSVEMMEQEIKIGFDKRLICPYIMFFQNDFVFSNEQTGGEFRCVSMELMNCSLESLLNLLDQKDTNTFFPLRKLFVIEVLFVYLICTFCNRGFYISLHKFYLVLGYSIFII
jgi:serine/threonine protein kinase